MKTVTANLYSYNEAKEKISELFSKIKEAPTKDKTDVILLKNAKVRTFIFILSFFLGILLMGVCFSIPVSHMIKHVDYNPIHHIVLFILAISIISFLAFMANIYDDNWVWLVKLQDKDYYEKYQHIGLFYSKTDYAKEILRIIKNTDAYMYETEKCKKTSIHVNFETDYECFVDFYYYRDIDSVTHQPIYDIKTIKFKE